MALRVGVNENLPVAEAIGFIRQLEPYELTLVEQPVTRDQIENLATIRRGILIPAEGAGNEPARQPGKIVAI